MSQPAETGNGCVMKLLMDTKTFIWWTLNDNQLSRKAYDYISDINNDIYFSVASAWELVLKYKLGKIVLPAEPELFIQEHLEKNRFSVLPVTLYHTLALRELPYQPKDAYYWMLIGQSRIENMPVITGNEKMSEFGVEIIW
jgi:PIN domain nuclease of toxin-antitoxin system